MKTCNKEDLFRYEGAGCHSFMTRLKYLLFVPGFQYSCCLRLAKRARNPLSRLFRQAMLRMMMYHTGIQIPSQVTIGRGLKFSHWGTIIVNERAVLGSNVTLSPGCTIGSAQGKRKGVPTLGNNVLVNTNAVIVGGVTIGNNVLIAPGAFVNFDVPDNSIVIGNPARIIERTEDPTAKYIVYPVENYPL